MNLPVSHTGFLEKRSGSTGSKYQPRFFIHHGRFLSYYFKPGDSMPLGVIDLAKAKIEVPGELSRLREHEFRISNYSKIYHLVGSSDADVETWTRLLSDAITRHEGKAADPEPTVVMPPKWFDLSKNIHRGHLRKQGDRANGNEYRVR